VRLHRFLLAAITYSLCIPLVLIARALTVMDSVDALATIAIMVAINLSFYVLFRSGANLRFADPSLTLAQTLAGIVVVLCSAYAMDHERALALFVCPVILTFGLFRFTMREFFLAAVFALVGYGLVIVLLLTFKPTTIK